MLVRCAKHAMAVVRLLCDVVAWGFLVRHELAVGKSREFAGLDFWTLTVTMQLAILCLKSRSSAVCPKAVVSVIS